MRLKSAYIHLFAEILIFLFRPVVPRLLTKQDAPLSRLCHGKRRIGRVNRTKQLVESRVMKGQRLLNASILQVLQRAVRTSFFIPASLSDIYFI
jgi:hypothetical protein